MKELVSINPANNKVLNHYKKHNIEDVELIIQKSFCAYSKWRKTTIHDRIELLSNVRNDLKKNLDEYAILITREMGKPILESIAEINKCISLCDYYFLNAIKFLEPEILDFKSKKSLVQFEPLGIIFGIMPWNFPFWQVFRFAIPSMISGNTVLLKHASNVQGVSILLNKIFNENTVEDVFRSLIIDTSLVSQIISNKCISAVSFTGSDIAGSKVAEICGMNIKKTVLELGGSDAFIVLEDVDLDKCIDAAITSRMINNGQSCIAAKRFIVHEKVHDEFVEKLKEKVENLKIGNPENFKTEIGPLATENILIDLDKQIQDSVNLGGSIITGGNRINKGGFYYSPTIIVNVSNRMRIYNEETFGPVFSIIKVKSLNEIIEIANDSDYGLGGSIWSKNENKALKIASEIQTGCVFINGFTRSDPKLPFGGIKKSGYGKELSKYGIREFVNAKTIVIY